MDERRAHSPGASPHAAPILRPGHNCWRISHASRAAFLIDGEAYFSALVSACEQARHSILLVGWDFDRRVRLLRDDGEHPFPVEAARFLDWLVRRRRGLHVHVLMWDFAMIYALERELLPVFKLGLRTHRRFHFRMDSEHPIGASQHQKVVVVDDAVAFVGGIDVSKDRWDTSAHHAEDRRRVDPDGVHYGPFHDVQMLVEGEAAACLGDLVRERWRHATGRRVLPPEPAGESRWPVGVEPDAHDVPIGIARTYPSYGGRREVREVAALYRDAIAAARDYIYIENQYFTSAAVGQALMARLDERDGPEVVIVLPQRSSGWLEENTMDVLRARLLRRLKAADRHGRLRIYYPHVDGLGAGCLNLHAKTMVVDGRFARVGSANTSNRSMGLDSECDLAIDATGEDDPSRAVVQAYLARLLGEQLDVPPGRVSAALAEGHGLIAAIEGLRGTARGLRELEPVTPAMERVVPDGVLLDPERSMDPDRLIEEYIPEEMRGSGRSKGMRFLLLLLALAGLAVLWRWSPMEEYLHPDRLAATITYLQSEPLAWAVIGGGFVLGSLLMIPLTLLILATAVTLGPWLGFIYALFGSLLSSYLAFRVGRLLGRDTVRRLAGERINKLSRKIASKGVLSVITVRVIPVAPFTLVNLVAGASHVSLRDFMLGTVVGMIPGLLMMVWFADSLLDVLRTPDLQSVLVLLMVVLLITAAGLFAQRWLSRRGAGVIEAED